MSADDRIGSAGAAHAGNEGGTDPDGQAGPVAAGPDTDPSSGAPPPDAGRLKWVDRLPWWTAPAILLGVPLLVWILIQIDSRTFYDNLVWKYYWGPIVADAAGGTAVHNGVVARGGYTLINTLTWAGLLGVCLLGTAQMLRHFRAQMDSRLILAATGWVAAGSIWHVMQDADLFAPPLEYLFITPPIYLLFAAFGILSFLIAQYVLYVQKQAGKHAALQKLWFIMMLGVLLYVALWAKQWHLIAYYVNPLVVAAIAAASFFLIRWRILRTDRIDVGEFTLLMAVPNFLLSLVYVYSFVEGKWGWMRGGILSYGPDADGLPTAWLISTAGAAAACLIVYLVTRRAKPVVAQAFAHPINLLIIFAHVLDGLATAIGIDFIGTYHEKHVLAEAIRSFTENTLGADHPTLVGFLPVKFLVAVLVVWAIDVSGREDAAKNPVMTGLVKFAVIMVGLGPGIRNMVRMSLGI